MKNRIGNNFKLKSETGNRGEKSMDAALQAIEGSDSVGELAELQREFKMHLADYDQAVRQEVAEILINLLQYPSALQAQQHQEANRLGVYDLKLPKGEEQQQSWQELREGDSKILCNDCGLVVQPNSIPLCTSFQNFPKMGIAAYLYFQNIKNLIVLLILLACFYCSYALYVNIGEPSSSSNPIKKISFASTVQNLTKNTSLYDSMLKEGWLVAAGVLLWWFALFIMKRMAIKQERMVDDETITAADFSIMLEHLPVTSTKESLQKDLDSYFAQIKEHQEMHKKDELRPFKIRKFCKATPFYFLDDQSIKEKIEEIDVKISERRAKIADFVYEEVIKTRKFITKLEDRKKLYAQFRELLEQRKKQEEELKLLSKNFDVQQNKDLTTVAFVVFQCSESANAIQACNPRGFGAVLRYYLSCCKSGIYFLQSKGVAASRAPQPQDIIWQNIGIPQDQIFKRKLLTYFVTFLILCTSFGIVYGFTILQMTYKSSILSIAISLSITIINIVIGIAIRRLTIYESATTSTNRQTGLALKSIFAQLINSTIVPVVTNIYIKKNTYEADGLVYDIFFLSITNTLLPPLLKLVDIPYRIKQFTINFMLDDPNQKLPLSQKELNKIYEYPEYQLGVAYIYYIDIFYFTCFYVFVHPFVVVFALIGFSLMYWAQKNAILTRSRRPAPGSAVLNEMMGQLVGFAPCVLSIGQLIWFNIIREDYHNFSEGTSASHWASLGFSLAFFFLPFNAIFNAYCAIPDDEDLIYQQIRGQLTSQYDLLNPVTAQQALHEFISANNKEQKRHASGKQPAKPTPPQTQTLKINPAKLDSQIQLVADMEEANKDESLPSSRFKKERKSTQKNNILEPIRGGEYVSTSKNQEGS